MADQTSLPIPSMDSLASMQLPPQVQPTGPTPADLMSLFASRIAQGDQAIQNQRAIAQQMAAVPQAPVGYNPPQVSGFLPNLWRDLKIVGASTAPGQAILETTQAPALARRAQSLSALKAQMGPEEEATKFNTAAAEGAGRLGYEQGMLGIRKEQTDIQKQKADAYQQGIQNRLMVGMRSLDLKQLLAGSQLELNKAKTLLDTTLAQVAPERLQIEQYGIDTNNATRMAVANVMSQLGIDKSHSFSQMVDSMFGTSMTPSAPQVPSGQQPVQSVNPLPQRPSTPVKPNKGGGKTQHLHFDAQGNMIQGK